MKKNADSDILSHFSGISTSCNRLIDTHMAGAYVQAGVTELWTANKRAFENFDVFDFNPHNLSPTLQIAEVQRRGSVD